MWAQLGNPSATNSVFAACASASTGEWIDATIVLAVVVNVGTAAVASSAQTGRRPSAQVQTRTNIGDGGRLRFPSRGGPRRCHAVGRHADSRNGILEATDCFVSEAVLTGELQPRNGPERLQRLRANAGASVARTFAAEPRGAIMDGTATEFGAVAARLNVRPRIRVDRRIGASAPNDNAMLVLVLVFVAHMLRGRLRSDPALLRRPGRVGRVPSHLGVSLPARADDGAPRRNVRG